MDISQAITRIAERTVDNRKLWAQALRQRRTEFTDIYGVPFYSEIDSNKKFQCHISISPDMEYYERFQFKIVIQADEAISGFKFEMTDADTYEDGAYNWINLTPYLIEQTDVWVDGAGYFPTDGIDEDDYYDLLDVGCLLTAEGKEDERETILSGGNKIVRITSDTKCDVSLILFLKYSSLNR